MTEAKDYIGNAESFHGVVFLKLLETLAANRTEVTRRPSKPLNCQLITTLTLPNAQPYYDYSHRPTLEAHTV